MVEVDINEKDYYSTILTSLPISLANFALVQLATVHMLFASKTIAPDELISMINEESDHQKVYCVCHAGPGKSKD